jgi:hypothetical protein
MQNILASIYQLTGGQGKNVDRILTGLMTFSWVR